MNWFNLEELEHKISTNNLTDKEVVNYMLANIIYGSILNFFTSMQGLNRDTIIGLLITLLVGILLLNKTFSINNEFDGKDFFKRLLAVSWIIRMKLLKVYIIFLVLYLVVFDITVKDPRAEIFSLIFTLIIGIATYSMTIKSFKRIALT